MAKTGKSRSRQAVTIDGVKYDSRTAAAKALFTKGGMTATEIAKAVGMTSQTVCAVTTSAEKVKANRAKYTAIRMGKSGTKTVGEISKKVGISTGKLILIFKKVGVTPLTADAKKAIEKAKSVSTESNTPDTKVKATKTPKAKSVSTESNTPDTKVKATKTPKAKKGITTEN